MSEEVLTGTQPAGQVERVDCEHSHNSQVVGIKKLSGNNYPGEKQLYDLALKECAQEFESPSGICIRCPLPKPLGRMRANANLPAWL